MGEYAGGYVEESDGGYAGEYEDSPVGETSSGTVSTGRKMSSGRGIGAAHSEVTAPGRIAGAAMEPVGPAGTGATADEPAIGVDEVGGLSIGPGPAGEVAERGDPVGELP